MKSFTFHQLPFYAIKPPFFHLKKRSMKPTYHFIGILTLLISITTTSWAQSPASLACDLINASVYGNSQKTERGYSLSPNSAGDGYYVAGHANENVLLMEFGLDGVLRWSRIIDVVPNVADHAVSIITDSDGMIGVSGMATANPYSSVGGSAFVFRFDPNSKAVLWAREVRPSATGDRVHGLNQNGPGGNYLLISNAIAAGDDDVQITAIELQTGEVVNGLTNHIELGGSETIWELVHFENALYGVGRYARAAGSQTMRHVITKMDAVTLAEIWTRLGHLSADDDARLYGFDILIDNGALYSGYYGDANGTSTTNTTLYIQKSTLDGEIIWIKEYDLPTDADWGYEIVKSGEGFVVYAVDRNADGSLYLFKIDVDGNVLWSNQYGFDGTVNTLTFNVGSSELIAVGDQLVFTATATFAGDQSVLIIQTDGNGQTTLPCVNTVPVVIVSSDVQDPVFLEVNVEESVVERTNLTHTTAVLEYLLEPLSSCAAFDTIFQTVEATICSGETFESYSASGTYIDAFITSGGCDSIRTLQLTVENCGCGSDVTGIYGTDELIERGYSLSPTAEGDGYYICGIREDSVLILKRNLQSIIEWSVTLDVNPDRNDHPVSIITDADGMIGIVGMSAEILYAGGEPFALRFNPYTRQLLWLRQFDTPVNRDRVHSLYQHADVANGNYLMLSNPVNDNDDNDDFLITEIDPQSGVPKASGSHNFDYLSADFILDMATYEGDLYGIGRFTDGEFPPKMRNTLIKFNPQTFEPEWTRLGHLPENVDARLYGFDIVIDNGFIYSGYYGDDDGQSITATKLWLQKTSLDGELIWLKQYDTPGNRDLGYEIIKQDDGLVVLAVKNSAPGAFYLFKVDTDGNVAWANSYGFETAVNTFVELFGASQLISVGNQLVFTGYTEAANGDQNLVVIQTDSIGRFEAKCITQASIDLPVVSENNPVFYAITPTTSTLNMPSEPVAAIPAQSTLPVPEACAPSDTIFTLIVATICEGDVFEGYTVTGVYEDIFTTMAGCDSVRTIDLVVENCCGEDVASVYGQPGITEQGLIISRALNNGGYYIAGTRSDSVLIMYFTTNDELVWSHQFDAVPGIADYPSAMITDSEGMLAIVGMGWNFANPGGNPFIARFNPNTQTVLWSQEIQSSFDFDRVHGISQNGPGGNYLLSTNPLEFQGNEYNDFQLMEFDPQTGAAITGKAKNFHFSNAAYIFDLVRHGDYLYGTGRFSIGVGLDLLRNTIIKLDATTLDEVWTRVGWVDQSIDQRVYGFDLLIDNNFIYSAAYGDPDGMSVTQTELYVQKTTLDGEIIWLKEYDLPLNTDFGWEFVKSGNGYVILATDRSTNGELYMFKIDSEGDVLWARHYDVNLTVNTVSFNIGGDQLISINNDLILTASVEDAGGGEDVLVIHTDQFGFTDAPCVTERTIPVEPVDIPNPLFYEINVVETDSTFVQTAHPTQSHPVEMEALLSCGYINIIDESIEAIICEGESFLGYEETGVYVDTFLLPDGCDSLRTLILTVLDCEPVVYFDLDGCRSYMSDGSIMDYSEFTPEYIGSLDCGDVESTILFRDPPAENKHSCTEGLNGTLAMCISALSTCTYLPGDDASAVFEVTFTPDQDSVIAFNKLEFYEKAPANYSWIDGPNGPNNYPRFYGIRILLNGTEVFEQHDISTSLTWALQSYSFNDLPEFTINGPSTFRVELLPYCPVNNGAAVSAWDLEDIRVFASCVPVENDGLTIDGTVRTWNDSPVYDANMILSNHKTFEASSLVSTASEGYYRHKKLQQGRGYHLKAEKHFPLMQGVSTLDIITLQKHLLGKQPLRTVDQFIAADINRDGAVNVMDLVYLRKAILGMIHEFPNNTSWRFAVKPFDIHTAGVNDFVEKAYIESLVAPVSIDWLGVKIGDINRDMETDLDDNPIAIRSGNTYPVLLSERASTEPGYRMVEVIAGETVEMEGFQLAFSTHGNTIAAIIPGEINLTREFYSVDQSGALRISWNHHDHTSFAAGMRLFTIVLKDNVTVSSRQLTLATHAVTAEVYADDTRAIELQYAQHTSATNASLAMEVAPNPFSDQFTIAYAVPVTGVVRLDVFNALGVLVYSSEKTLSAGQYQQVITSAMIGDNHSMLFCRLMAGDEVISRKVVRK
jgi:hypothetical protein